MSRFCSECGAALVAEQCPKGHRCWRPMPKIQLSTFIHSGQKLLWMKRNRHPQKGFWAIPGGFMESGETLQEGAARELREETGLVINAHSLQLYMVGTITFINEVYISFHAEAPNETLKPGSEASDAAFFSREELPWQQVAYPSANNAIVRAYEDMARGEFPQYHAIVNHQINELHPLG